MIKRKNILVTGGGGASGMYTIKILKDSTNHYVVGCDCSGLSSGLYLADSHYIVPPAKEQDNFLSKINEIIENEKIDIVIPNVDEELPLFAKFSKQILPIVVISPEETINICMDKYLTIEALKGLIPCPETRLGSELTHANLPCIIKPRISRGSRNIYSAENLEELVFFTNFLERRGFVKDDLIIQEYLPGIEYTVDLLCGKQGEFIVAVPRERVRTSGGLSQTGKTVHREDIINNCKKIADKLKFFGPINLQFKEDTSGTAKITEINPRFSGGLPITYAAGVNAPLLLLKILYDEQIPPNEIEWQEGYVLRYLDEMFISM